MSASESQLTAIYKSRNNILRIQRSRGYDVSEYEGTPLNVLHLMKEKDQLDMLIKNKDSGRKTYIKYYLGKSLRASNVEGFIEDLFTYESILTEQDDLIIISKDGANASLKQALQNMWNKQNILITVISIPQLQFNILEHDLVPEHKVLTDDEKSAVYRKHNINNDSELPEISRFDPVALVLCMRPGQVCRIIRDSKTAIKSEAYRVCCP